MSTIFISHASADNALAVDLGARLRKQGHTCVFLDLDPEQGIVAGRSWERTLYRKLRACRVVVALCTDSYLQSQWCFAEIALARMEGKPIVALLAEPLAEGAKLPSIISETQFIDCAPIPRTAIAGCGAGWRIWTCWDRSATGTRGPRPISASAPITRSTRRCSSAARPRCGRGWNCSTGGRRG